MFERKHEKLAPISVFKKRVALCFMLSGVLIFGALLIGVAGYHWIAGLDWIDALLNASMILGGMGPVNQLTSNSAKVFASGYSLFSGLLFIALMGIVLSPIVHRMLHQFHLDDTDLKK